MIDLGAFIESCRRHGLSDEAIATVLTDAAGPEDTHDWEPWP